MTLIHNLQALRGIAAMMVVLHHAREILAQAYPAMADIQIGAAGVDVFFVLSGVVITLSEHQGARRPWEFLRLRIIRVAPMYWLALSIVGVLLLVGLSPLGVQPRDATPANFLASMAFLPFERAHGAIMPLLGVGWTLNYEMFFYLVFALALALPRRARVPALALTMIALVLIGLLWPASSVAGQFYTNPILLEFVFGALLARWFVARSFDRSDTIFGVALVVLSITGFGFAATHSGFEQLMTERVLIFGIPALLLVAGAMVLDSAGWRLGNPYWLMLGAASYVLYLFHTIILQIVEKAVETSALDLSDPVVAFTVAAVAVVTSQVMAVLIHRRVEAPVTRALKSAGGSWDSARATPRPVD